MDRLEGLLMGVVPDTLTDAEIAILIKRTPRRVRQMAHQENWPHITEKCRGGKKMKYHFRALPEAIQNAWRESQGDKTTHGNPTGENAHPHKNLENLENPHNGIIKNDGEIAKQVTSEILQESQLLPVPSFSDIAFPGNGGALSPANGESWTPDRAISIEDIRDKRVQQIYSIVQDALAVPPGAKKRPHIESVALRHGIPFPCVYRYLNRYEKRGLAGICHRKSTQGKPKTWTPDAVDFWIGLVLKREHRKIDLKALYQDVLLVEAHRRGWLVGRYESALWWCAKRISPQLWAIQRGGGRGLDNVLPPIRRDYSDLAPFEILVGDQHKFDFWVVDDDTGEVFRPEGYFWQDLRTRTIYGGAVDKRYDSWLIGMALRIGIRAYGGFGSIYTDNGKPELSHYLMGILSDMRALHLSWEREEDLPMDVLDKDPEEINPAAYQIGSHRKAIVKNAKAKMIEGTFSNIEGIIRGHFRLPGYVKDLGGDIHENEIDEKEIKRLAESGKLPLFSEFIITLYKTLDYYNQEKPHAGVLSEWAFNPKPKKATPFDCLKSCYVKGWRPRMVSEEASDLIFMAKAERIVSLGRVRINNNHYEHEALIELTDQQVDLRYNPLDPEWVMVFKDRRYVCTAQVMEYSSMKDPELAERKIHEKRARHKKFLEQFRVLTSRIPDFRQYSEVSPIEKVAALVGAEKKRRIEAKQDLYRKRTAEELEAEAKRIEEGKPLPAKRREPIPDRPTYFFTEHDRYKWCVRCELAGGSISEEDSLFMKVYEGKMTEGEREHWETVREYGSL